MKLKLHLLAVSTQCGTFVNLFHKIAAHCRWTQRLDIILALLLIMLYSLYYYHTATKRSEDVTMWPHQAQQLAQATLPRLLEVYQMPINAYTSGHAAMVFSNVLVNDENFWLQITIDHLFTYCVTITQLFHNCNHYNFNITCKQQRLLLHIPAGSWTWLALCSHSQQ